MRLPHPWRPPSLASSLLLLLTLATGSTPAARALEPWPPLLGDLSALTGTRSRLTKDWVGLRPLPTTTPILVMAGHADSQGLAGAGTSGAAVARHGRRPMDPSMTDELFWNLRVARAVVDLGLQRGLTISFYDPPQRTIANPNDPRTTWSVGRAHVAAGGYALEIHHDAYGPDGIGSGLIPPLRRPLSRLDESLANTFGAYPFRFRNGLGAPKRGIAILEIGKLEAPLEPALRDPLRSEEVVNQLARQIVEAMVRGLTTSEDPEPVAQQRRGNGAGNSAGTGNAADASSVPDRLSPGPGGAGSDPAGNRLQASSEGG